MPEPCGDSVMVRSKAYVPAGDDHCGGLATIVAAQVVDDGPLMVEMGELPGIKWSWQALWWRQVELAGQYAGQRARYNADEKVQVEQRLEDAERERDELRAQKVEAEGGAAKMREALEKAPYCAVVLANDYMQGLTTAPATPQGMAYAIEKQLRVLVAQALSSQAGREMLERLERAEDFLQQVDTDDETALGFTLAAIRKYLAKGENDDPDDRDSADDDPGSDNPPAPGSEWDDWYGPEEGEPGCC